MDITFAQYIDRPGLIKGSATNSMINLVKQDYRRRFDAVFIRESSVIVYNLYKDKNKYYIYIKMPSEQTVHLYYDVVLEFTPNKAQLLVDSDLDKMNVKFFSNDPAFLFTYAYAFNKAGLIIDWLKPKLSNKALTEKPIIRNPKADTGYVKSLYFAYYFIMIRKLFSRDNVSWQSAKELNKSSVANQIPDFDTKLDDVRRIKKIEQDKKRMEREAKKIAANPTMGEHVKRTKVPAKVQNVKKTKITQTVARTKRVLKSK